MNFIKFLSVLGVVVLTGCSSMVVTYDATGQVIGSCKATRGLLSTASAHCSGSGDAIGVNYSTTDASGNLPLLPSNTQITLQR